MQARASESTSDYRAALSEAMELLAADPRVVFLGQGMNAGTFMSLTLQGVADSKKIELPVMEEAQCGMCIGMALAGYIPICVLPRWNFALLAANQLVNHLDKMRAHVIVRVGVGSTKPLDPGPQHKGDFGRAFAKMMPNTAFHWLQYPSLIVSTYKRALAETACPHVIIEEADLYET